MRGGGRDGLFRLRGWNKNNNNHSNININNLSINSYLDRKLDVLLLLLLLLLLLRQQQPLFGKDAGRNFYMKPLYLLLSSQIRCYRFMCMAWVHVQQKSFCHIMYTKRPTVGAGHLKTILRHSASFLCARLRLLPFCENSSLPLVSCTSLSVDERHAWPNVPSVELPILLARHDAPDVESILHLSNCQTETAAAFLWLRTCVLVLAGPCCCGS